MTHLKTRTLAVFIATTAGITGCGGSSNDNNDDDTPPETSSETGVFLDSPVANIGYRTETKEGVTNEKGEYQYETGEQVTFFIGDLEFPPVLAAGVVTPLDIAGTTDTASDTVVNIARLLQTLDTDGDASNGITISDIAKNSATQVDFTLTVTEFGNSTSVKTLIQNGGQDSATAALISPDAARSHLEGTLAKENITFTNPSSITGGWLLGSSSGTGNGTERFIFFAFDASTNTYVHVEEKEFPDETEEGMEYGTFNLDESNTLTAPTNFFDENGTIGLHPDSNEGRIELSLGDNPKLNLYVDGNPSPIETIPATRIESDGIVGTWIYENENPAEQRFTLFAFLKDGTYVQAGYRADEPVEEQGAEVGSYNFDTNSNVISISNVILDTNETAGLSGGVGTADLKGSVSGNKLTITVTEDGGEETLIFNRL